ncbi:MAG TPA: hypothetical protein VMT52_12380 [Planctomycetota bacterium]|nr:hypothetical protein [Planctomycetota bacterium]
MPLRVKCRCGQELVLRYGEWVYVFLGIVLLTVVVNSVALVLLYLRITDVSVPPAGNAPAPVAVSPPSAPPGGVDTAPGPRASPEAPAPSAVPPLVEGTPPEPEPRSGPGAKGAPPTPGSTGAGPRQGEPSPASDGAAGVLKAESALETPEEDWSTLESVFASPDLEPEAAPVLRAPWLEGGVLFRLLGLERVQGDASLVSLFLLDPDPRLARRALGALLSPGADLSPLASRGAATFVETAAGALGDDEALKRLLGLLKVTAGDGAPPSPAERAEATARAIASHGEEVRGKLGDAAAATLRDALDASAASGLDVVLAIDVTQSMAGTLEDLGRECLWILPCLSWAVPGSRLGLILYRDGVEKAVDFSATPHEETLRALLDARAEGGGDVPEGVHAAVKGALSLGVMRWRAGATKHIVLVGDAPPPHAELESLLSLLRRALEEGGYRVHALGVRPDEGHSVVPFFEEIARAGGGTTTTLGAAERLGPEVLAAIFPREARPAVEALVPTLRALFAPERRSDPRAGDDSSAR